MKIIILEEKNEGCSFFNLPINKESLLDFFKEASKEPSNTLIKTPNPSLNNHYEDYVFIHKGCGYKKVAIMNIIYLEADRNYCDIFFADGSSLNVSMPMIEVYEYLSPKLFKRIHRSYIVNIEHVDTYVGNMIKLCNGKEITIGRNYREFVKSDFICIGSRKRIRVKDNPH